VSSGGQDDDADDRGRAVLVRRTLRASRSGKSVAVAVRCARGAQACAGSVRLVRAGRSTGRAAFRLAPGASRTVRVRLGARDRAVLRRSGRLRVKVAVATRGASFRRSALVRD